MKRLILCLALVCSGSSVLHASTTRLSELDLRGIRLGYGQARADVDVSNGPLRIGGEVHEHGVGTHAPSSWTLKLDGKATRLSGRVGVVTFDQTGKGSCEFTVRSADKVLWHSGVMRNGDPAKPLDLSLAGLAEITLEVAEADHGNDSDHAAWCCSIEHDGAPLPLLPPVPPPMDFIDAGPVADGATIEASAFGIVADSDRDAGPALRALFAKLRGVRHVTVVLQPGSYAIGECHAVRRDWPQSNTDALPLRRYGVVLEDLEGVTLRSGSALFKCSGTLTPLAVVNCRRVTVEGIRIDWPRPPMSQATVVSSDGATVVIRPHPETPLEARDGVLQVVGGADPGVRGSAGWGGRGIWAMMEWDPATGCPAYRRGDLGGVPRNAIDQGDGTIRVHADGFKAGNVMLLRHDPRSHCGVLVHRSSAVTFRRTMLHACCGLGYLFQHSTDLTLVDTHAIPRPDSGRFFSGHDDGFQISGCGGRVEIRGCRFAGLMDDPINVHGTYLDVVRRVDPRTLELRFAHPQSQNQPWADPGDEVAFSKRSNLLREGGAKVLGWRLTSPGTGRLEFDRDLPAGLGEGWVVENMTMSPAVAIRGCAFLGNRARGLLVTTPKPVVIEDNLFRSSGAAILINGDCNGWFESGAVADVLVRNNRFEDCLLANYQFCEGVISIVPTNTAVDGPVHRNIRIEGNRFMMFDAPLLYARAVEGLTFADNRIQHVGDREPWHPRKAAITLEHCSEVSIRGNTAGGNLVSREVRCVDSSGVRVAPGDALR